MTDTTGEEATRAMKPQFKKRGFKGKIRQTEPSIEVKVEEDAFDVDDSIDKQKLDDLRKLREFKKRKAGTDVTGAMNKAARMVKGRSDSEGIEAQKVSGIGATMKSQFSSNRRMYDDPIGSIAHSDIMEKYVEEKLGLAKSEDDDGLEVSATAPANSVQGINEEENEQAGFYTGIAEVELDESYKLKNIQDTEKSLLEMAVKRKLAKEKERGPELGYVGRFIKPKSRADYIEEERREALESAPAPTVALPPGAGSIGEEPQSYKQNKSSHRGHTSSDTRMLMNFKARQKY